MQIKLGALFPKKERSFLSDTEEVALNSGLSITIDLLIKLIFKQTQAENVEPCGR